MKRSLTILLVLICFVAVAQTISYFNQGFLRQGTAQLDRNYLGIYGSNIFYWGTNAPWTSTNYVLRSGDIMSGVLSNQSDLIVIRGTNDVATLQLEVPNIYFPPTFTGVTLQFNTNSVFYISSPSNQFKGDTYGKSWWGDGFGLTNLNGTNLVGLLTNNTTGSAATSSVATNAADGGNILTNNYYGNLNLSNIVTAKIMGGIGTGTNATNIIIGSRILQTNSTLNTHLDLNATANPPGGKFIEYKTNNVSKFSITTDGILTIASALSCVNIGCGSVTANSSISSVGTGFGGYQIAGKSWWISALNGTWTMVDSSLVRPFTSDVLVNWPTFSIIGNTNKVSLSLNGSLAVTNGVIQMVYATNGVTVCTTNRQTYLLSGTNELVTLVNAANVPNVIYRFSSTNQNGSFIVTNATGTQTIRDGAAKSYTNFGVGEIGFISDGAHWWLASKGKTVFPNASWSTSTNTTFPNITNTITLQNTDHGGDSQGIGLDNSAWFTFGVGSRIWITNSGDYMLTFSAVWAKGAGSPSNGDIWLRKNGTDVANTATIMTIAANATNVMTVNLFLNVTAPSYFDLQGASTDGNGLLQALPAITSPFNRPAMPSIIVTVNKISD